MTDEQKPRRRGRVAALAAEVRELREEVARLRAAQQVPCAHVCTHVCAHPAWQPMWWRPAIWCGGAVAGNTVLNLPPGSETVGSTTTCVQPAGYTSTYTVSL